MTLYQIWKICYHFLLNHVTFYTILFYTYTARYTYARAHSIHMCVYLCTMCACAQHMHVQIIHVHEYMCSSTCTPCVLAHMCANECMNTCVQLFIRVHCAQAHVLYIRTPACVQLYTHNIIFGLLIR